MQEAMGAMLSAQQRKKRHSSNLAMKGPICVQRHTGTYLGRNPSRELVRSLVERPRRLCSQQTRLQV